MIWARNKYGKGIRKKASPKDKGVCPICDEEVIAKCGSIKIWHWAHKSNSECDSFGEPETEWHRDWKNNFPEECQEVVIGNHRADVKTEKGLVIEFQNSPISPEQIEEREKFYGYGNMIWVLNGDKIAKNIDLREKKVITFRWKHPPKSWWIARQQIYIDLGEFDIGTCVDEFIFKIRRIYKKCPCGGWGELLLKKEFLKRCKHGLL